MEESILKLQLLEKKDLAEPEIDIRYSSMTQPLNRIVQYIRQQEYPVSYTHLDVYKRQIKGC